MNKPEFVYATYIETTPGSPRRRPFLRKPEFVEAMDCCGA
jgi:hypothetical protein